MYEKIRDPEKRKIRLVAGLKKQSPRKPGVLLLLKIYTLIVKCINAGYLMFAEFPF